MSFNNSESVGPYSLPTRLLKSLRKPVSEAFSLIVNDSFSNGTYPGKLKVGKVVAIHKKVPVTIPLTIVLHLFCQLLVKLLES